MENLDWFFDEDNVWRLRDKNENHRAGCSFVSDSYAIPAHWTWAAFPQDYVHGSQQKVATGAHQSLKVAKQQAFDAVLKMDSQTKD